MNNYYDLNKIKHGSTSLYIVSLNEIILNIISKFNQIYYSKGGISTGLIIVLLTKNRLFAYSISMRKLSYDVIIVRSWR